MPRVSPFRGLGYALDRFGASSVPERVRLAGEASDQPGRIADLTDLVCPPYDVIDADQQRALLARHPRNAIRLELNPAEKPHRAAAETLMAWRRDGTLERPRQAYLYSYAHARAGEPTDLAVRGALSRVLLEPWGAGIRPHEHTMPGPRAERLGLLRATATQLSPILAIYFDRSERYRHLMGRGSSDEWRARDPDGLLHQLAAAEPDERLVNYLSRQRLLVADGHHRYETALAYQASVRARPEHRGAPPGSLAVDWVMAVLVNAEREGLTILPTHRLLRDVDPQALRNLVAQPGPLCDALPVAAGELAARIHALRDDPRPSFGLVLPGDEGYLLTGRTDAIAARMRREPMSPALQRLDLAVLGAAILSDRLGIDPAPTVSEGRILYTRSADDAVRRVRTGHAAAAFLVRATQLEQLAAVASAGDVMPQKSTYFYPKLLTGLVFNPLDSD